MHYTRDTPFAPLLRGIYDSLGEAKGI